MNRDESIMDSRGSDDGLVCLCYGCKARRKTIQLPLKFLSTASFVVELNDLTSQIGKDSTTLRRLWPRIKKDLRALWPLLTHDECKEILLRGNENMHENHRPELAAFDEMTRTRSYCMGEREPEDMQNLLPMDVRRLQLAFTYPYMTFEDLCYRENLLLLLETRDVHHPEHFVLSDLIHAGIPALGHSLSGPDTTLRD